MPPVGIDREINFDRRENERAAEEDEDAMEEEGGGGGDGEEGDFVCLFL